MKPRVFGSEQFTKEWTPETAHGMVYMDVVLGYDDSGNPITITKSYVASEVNRPAPPYEDKALVTALQHDSGVTRNVPTKSLKGSR